MSVKIPLFKKTKGVPIYAKLVRELFLNKVGRKNKNPQIVHVVGQFVDLMLGKYFTTKYSYKVILVIDVYINNICISNTLINLWDSIIVMTKDTMERINLSNLRQTPTILQLVDQSTNKPNCVLEYILILKDS